MKIDKDKIRLLCKKRHLTLQRMLNKSKVSRNAYYSLTRKESVLPNSIIRISDVLGVQPGELLEEQSPFEKEAALQKNTRKMINQMERILKEHKDADPDNVRHTLILLEEEPIICLRRALLRGQKFNIYR